MPESKDHSTGPGPAERKRTLPERIAGVLDSWTKVAVAAFGLLAAVGLIIGVLRPWIPHHPVLVITATCKLNTHQIKPGTVVSLTYAIHSNLSTNVGLGAGIYDNQVVDHSTGFGDVSSFPLHAGGNTETRPVAIPARLQPGRYEIDGEIWPPNKVGANGANTIAGPTCALFTVPAGPPAATMTFPTHKSRVSKKHGFTAAGKAESLGNDTIWILDSHGSYTVDSKAKIAGNRWTARDFPIGDASQHPPFGLTLAAVLANQTCAKKLSTVLYSNDDYLPHLPGGCTVFAQVNLTVAFP